MNGDGNDRSKDSGACEEQQRDVLALGDVATAITERTALTRWFLFTAALVLFATGTAKVWSAFGRTKLLAAADPITGISFGHLMLTVGVLELVIASICLFGKSQKLKLGLIGWLATNFVVYRLGLWWMGWHKPCSCLGNLTDALHLSPELADNMMKVTLAYLLLGSYGLLLWQWRRHGGPLGGRPGME